MMIMMIQLKFRCNQQPWKKGNYKLNQHKSKCKNKMQLTLRSNQHAIKWRTDQYHSFQRTERNSLPNVVVAALAGTHHQNKDKDNMPPIQSTHADKTRERLQHKTRHSQKIPRRYTTFVYNVCMIAPLYIVLHMCKHVSILLIHRLIYIYIYIWIYIYIYMYICVDLSFCISMRYCTKWRVPLDACIARCGFEF